MDQILDIVRVLCAVLRSAQRTGERVRVRNLLHSVLMHRTVVCRRRQEILEHRREDGLCLQSERRKTEQNRRIHLVGIRVDVLEDEVVASDVKLVCLPVAVGIGRSNPRSVITSTTSAIGRIGC